MQDIHIRLHRDILWFILDRHPLNALTSSLLEQLTVAIRQACKHPPRLIVFTGKGEEAFCVGVDLPVDGNEQRQVLLERARDADDALCEMQKLKIPSVAVVKGKAYGAGCELVSFCDTIIAREDATFRLPEVGSSIFPYAVAHRLPSLIGQEQVTRLMHSEETLTAQEALHMGLAHQVLPMRRFLQDTEELLVVLTVTGTSA